MPFMFCALGIVCALGIAMFLIRKPSAAEIQTFLDRSRTLPLSYGNEGMVAQPPSDFDLDEHVVAIGHGRDAFERARR